MLAETMSSLMKATPAFCEAKLAYAQPCVRSARAVEQVRDGDRAVGRPAPVLDVPGDVSSEVETVPSGPAGCSSRGERARHATRDRGRSPARRSPSLRSAPSPMPDSLPPPRRRPCRPPPRGASSSNDSSRSPLQFLTPSCHRRQASTPSSARPGRPPGARPFNHVGSAVRDAPGGAHGRARGGGDRHPVAAPTLVDATIRMPGWCRPDLVPMTPGRGRAHASRGAEFASHHRPCSRVGSGRAMGISPQSRPTRISWNL